MKVDRIVQATFPYCLEEIIQIKVILKSREMDKCYREVRRRHSSSFHMEEYYEGNEALKLEASIRDATGRAVRVELGLHCSAKPTG